MILNYQIRHKKVKERNSSKWPCTGKNCVLHDRQAILSAINKKLNYC